MRTTTGTRDVPVYEDASRTLGWYDGEDGVFAWVLCFFTGISTQHMEDNVCHAVLHSRSRTWTRFWDVNAVDRDEVHLLMRWLLVVPPLGRPSRPSISRAQCRLPAIGSVFVFFLKVSQFPIRTCRYISILHVRSRTNGYKQNTKNGTLKQRTDSWV